MNLLIGLGYQARHGKDTVAKAILEARGGQYDIRLYPFAAALKKEYTEACREAGGAYQLIQRMRLTHNLPDWVQYEFDADMTDPLCPYGKQRALLQWWGTEYRRKQDPFYWTTKTTEAIQRDNPQVAIITDVRFPNEGLLIKAFKGYLVNVVREGYVDALASGHASEHAMRSFPWDITLSAKEGDLAQLKADAVELFDMIVDWETPKDISQEDFLVEAA